MALPGRGRAYTTGYACCAFYNTAPSRAEARAAQPHLPAHLVEAERALLELGPGGAAAAGALADSGAARQCSAGDAAPLGGSSERLREYAARAGAPKPLPRGADGGRAALAEHAGHDIYGATLPAEGDALALRPVGGTASTGLAALATSGAQRRYPRASPRHPLTPHARRHAAAARGGPARV